MILLGLFRQIVRALTRLSSHYFSTMHLGRQANWQQIVPFEFCISGATKQVRAFKLGNGELNFLSVKVDRRNKVESVTIPSGHRYRIGICQKQLDGKLVLGAWFDPWL